MKKERTRGAGVTQKGEKGGRELYGTEGLVRYEECFRFKGIKRRWGERDKRVCN